MSSYCHNNNNNWLLLSLLSFIKQYDWTIHLLHYQEVGWYWYWCWYLLKNMRHRHIIVDICIKYRHPLPAHYYFLNQYPSENLFTYRLLTFELSMGIRHWHSIINICIKCNHPSPACYYCYSKIQTSIILCIKLNVMFRHWRCTIQR